MAHFNSYPILIKIIHFQLTLGQKLWWFNPSIVFYAVCYEFAVHSNSDQIMFLLCLFFSCWLFFLCMTCFVIKQNVFHSTHKINAKKIWRVIVDVPYRLHSFFVSCRTQCVRWITKWTRLGLFNRLVNSCLRSVKTRKRKRKRTVINGWKHVMTKTQQWIDAFIFILFYFITKWWNTF